MGARTRSGSQRLCLDDAEKAFVCPTGTVEATDGNLERRTGVGCTHDGQGQVLHLGVSQESGELQ